MSGRTPLARAGRIERGLVVAAPEDVKDVKDTTVVSLSGDAPSQLSRDLATLDDRRYRDTQALLLGE